MELRTTREMRRNEQLSKVMARKAESSEGTVQPQPAAQLKTPADKVSISAQALSFLEEQSRLAWEQDAHKRRDWMDESLSGLEEEKSELDQLSAQLKVLEKCQKIAASIMKGDKVPPKDMEFLRENDPDGYKLALALRHEKKDPKKCKSVLEDEDQRGQQTQSAGAAEEASSSVESSGEAAGGGDAADCGGEE